jgi:hypothetical protein
MTAEELQAKIDGETFRGFKVGELRRVFTAYESPDGWKEPNEVVIAHEYVTRLAAAVVFFLGCEATVVQDPVSRRIRMSWPGYAY